MHKVSYRPDVDGLRAIAVGAVVLDHVNISKYFNGGFVGVDVFFVISGYLIGTILFTEIAAGDFSILSFYRRRVLRILPALFAMIAAATVASFLYQFPVEMKDYAASALAAIASLSNIFFWTRSGYFEGDAQGEPLLHTWSLAIEEQFYLFFPLLLLLVRRRFRGYTAHVVLGLGAASLAFSIVWVSVDSSFAFYLLPARAWELMLGATLALNPVEPRMGAVGRNVLSLGGLAMIIVPIFLYDAKTPFPGLAALPPCLGTALLIHTGGGQGTIISKILSLKPVVFVGLISYSLYLWHWPIIAFQRLGMPFPALDSPRWVSLALIALSVLVATLSWRFIETPFRRGRFRRVEPRRVFIWAAAAAAPLVVASAAIFLLDGLAAGFPKDAAAVASYLRYDSSGYTRQGTCFLTPEMPFSQYDTKHCLAVVPPRRNYLLLGDSHGAHLWYGLARKFPALNVQQASASNCVPTLSQPLTSRAYCAQLMSFVYRTYLATHRDTRLLLAARWSAADLTALSETLLWLKARGIGVVVIGPLPQYSAALPRLLAMSLRDGNDGALRRGFLQSKVDLDREMKAIAAANGAGYVSVIDLLCSRSGCEHYAAPGVPLQYDYGHLTREGSVLVARRLRERGGL